MSREQEMRKKLLYLAKDCEEIASKLSEILEDYKTAVGETEEGRELREAFIKLLENQIAWLKLTADSARISAGKEEKQ